MRSRHLHLVLFLCCCLPLLAGTSCKAAPTVQEPAVAGMFYAADRETLRKQVAQMLKEAPKKELPGQLIGLIAPHAGYRYSGPIAAAAFKQLEGRRFKTVIVIAPSHRVPFRGVSLSTRDLYRTPLGDILIDANATRSLIADHHWAVDDPRPYASEHALEVELPFLQEALGSFTLIPMIVGQVDEAMLGEVASALNSLAEERNALIVASSDLSHFHPYEEAVKRDQRTVESICKDPEPAFFAKLTQGELELCGSSPVDILKRIARLQGAQLKLIEYANSGDTAGEKSRVVGYAAIAVVKPPTSVLSSEQKQALLMLARKTVTAHVRGEKLPPLPGDPLLKKDGAAFVTLKKNGELRGCIGQILAQGPLDRTVQRMAVAASSADPRFPPVQSDELQKITVEVSVLTPPEPLSDPLAVRVGRDGLILEKGMHRGVLLPQVPLEQGWNKHDYLTGICRKSGLPPQCWKEAHFKRFQAIVFGEEKGDH